MSLSSATPLSALYLLQLTTPVTVTQDSGTVTASISSNNANILLTTSSSGYSVLPGEAVAFIFNNTVINPASSIQPTIISHSGTLGCPYVQISAISYGNAWITVRNVSNAETLNGTINVGLLVYNA